jgi:hypothetical protein
MHLSLSVFTKSIVINRKGCESKFVRNVLITIRHANFIVLPHVTLYHVMLHGPVWLSHILCNDSANLNFFERKLFLAYNM